MRYLPHTSSEIEQMLRTIGVASIDDLFSSIPPNLRLKDPLPLPPALPELELRNHLRTLSRKNAHGAEWINFLGGGTYSHYIPSAVGHLLKRSEFSTGYTPYQAEVSQGTLQTLFEFQTMVAELCGMEIANASIYDGATATAEAILMALRLNRRHRVLLARSLHPAYRRVIKTYLRFTDFVIEEVTMDPDTAMIDRNDVAQKLDDDTSCLVAAYPNFFGVIEDLSDLAATLHQNGSLLISATPEPWALALAKSPGEMDVDIAVAEGQSFGNTISYGGPSLGLFATRKQFVRQVPGRLVGETVDREGRRGYVLTLATREQHIRRQKATSNICTNVSLCAVAATITLALLGQSGFRKIAQDNLQKAEQAKRLLTGIKGIELAFSGTTFNEFVVKLSQPPETLLAKLREAKILGGLPLARWYPELENSLLICVTEMNSDEEITSYAERLREVFEY